METIARNAKTSTVKSSRRALLKSTPTAFAALAGASLLQRASPAVGCGRSMLTQEQRDQIHYAFDLAQEHLHTCVERQIDGPTEYGEEYLNAIEPLEKLMEELASEIRAAMPNPSTPDTIGHCARWLVVECLADSFACGLKLKRKSS